MTWNKQQNWRLLDFQGTWVFVGFSLVVANSAAKWPYMALWENIISHEQFGGWFFLLWARANHCVVFGGKFGPSITVWEGKILWEDVLCFIGWPERPLKVIVIAAIARILDKWWFLQRDLWFLLFQYPPTVSGHGC